MTGRPDPPPRRTGGGRPGRRPREEGVNGVRAALGMGLIRAAARRTAMDPSRHRPARPVWRRTPGWNTLLPGAGLFGNTFLTEETPRHITTDALSPGNTSSPTGHPGFGMGQTKP